MPWEYKGIRGRGNPPPLLGNFSGPLVICGSAKSLWADMDALGYVNADGMVINQAGLFFGTSPDYGYKLDHWVSIHGDNILTLKSSLAFDGYNNQNRRPKSIYMHTNKRIDGCISWGIEGADVGTSGLLAILVGLCLGYEKIILLGIPLDKSGYFFSHPAHRTSYGRSQEVSWRPFRGLIRRLNCVRSLGGLTARWFGTYTKEWINGGI